MPVLMVDQHTFRRNVLNSDKMVVVDFWAEWCSPCHGASRSLEIVAEEYRDQVVLARADVDVCHKLVHQFSIGSMPTFIFIKGGRVVHRHSGAVARSRIRAIFEELVEHKDGEAHAA